jgi:hypothetical protein
LKGVSAKAITRAIIHGNIWDNAARDLFVRVLGSNPINGSIVDPDYPEDYP